MFLGITPLRFQLPHPPLRANIRRLYTTHHLSSTLRWTPPASNPCPFVNFINDNSATTDSSLPLFGHFEAQRLDFLSFLIYLFAPPADASTRSAPFFYIVLDAARLQS